MPFERRIDSVPGLPPASSLVQVAGLVSPDYLVEVDAVVALPG